MAVDLGEARTGLAVCDKEEILAYPLDVIHEKSQKAILSAIKKAAQENNAQRIVVGHPRNMDGSFGERAKKCEYFAEKLRNTLDIDVVLFDERLTTKVASQYLNTANVREKKRKSQIDAAAAVVILEGYLKQIKNKK